MSEMTIGCALWTLGATPDVAALARQMEIAAEIGCASVQPWIVNVEYDPCILDPEVGSAEDRREVRRIAESLGLSFSGFCAQLQGAVTWGGLEESEGLQWRIDKTKQALDTTAELGGNVVTTHAGVLPEDKLDPAYEILLRSVGEIAEHGAKVGVYFALETGQETPKALGDFIDEIGNPWLKVNYDPCNLLRFGSEAGTIQGVRILGDKIIHTHAKDWNPATMGATCGEGLVPWDGYIQALRDIAYSGVLAIEDETGNENMIESIGRSYAFLQGFLDA
ncbi:MAG: sugar phosphate isomerase/epimerase [Chloroflexota bacterium]|nr:sugar phosphate isomerase/epimerase [Chloroflexota bacterium]MDE2910144.1 sugar phosphate isomerase/epimerase [Chloroflexota bacterium]